MATHRKGNGKWQAIVRHKNIGTTSRSFHTEQAAIKWVISVEDQLEAGTFATLRPTHITLGELLERYSGEATPAKRAATSELRRLQRLIRDPVSSLRANQLTSQAIDAFRDRRLLDGRRTCRYDRILIRHCPKIAMNDWGDAVVQSSRQGEGAPIVTTAEPAIGRWRVRTAGRSSQADQETTHLALHHLRH